MAEGPDLPEALRLIVLAAHPARAHALLSLLDGGNLPASELAEEIARSRATGSHHLSYLARAGQIAARRGQGDLSYSLTEEGERLAQLVARLAEMSESNGPIT
jgi:DNA-binding MarR family transcriptional regulator